MVENDFGRLKLCWRCLSKKLDYKTKNVIDILAACVTLHNLCQICGDTLVTIRSTHLGMIYLAMAHLALMEK